jgi:hypothetical protein
VYIEQERLCSERARLASLLKRLYSVQRAGEAVQCTVYSDQERLYSVQCTESRRYYSVQCTASKRGCTVYSEQARLASYLKRLYSVQRAGEAVRRAKKAVERERSKRCEGSICGYRQDTESGKYTAEAVHSE